MGIKFPLVIMAVALAVIGGGIVMMGQVGKIPDSLGNSSQQSSEGSRSSGRSADDPLSSTATYNVSEKLESGVNLITEIALIADDLNSPNREALEDLEAVDEIIQFHMRLFKTVPGGGENVDIMRKLTGGNERMVALIHPEHPALNDNGELVDRWGTPFHFHQISAKDLEIRSAGPDKALYTDDDVFLERGDEVSPSEDG